MTFRLSTPLLLGAGLIVFVIGMIVLAFAVADRAADDAAGEATRAEVERLGIDCQIDVMAEYLDASDAWLIDSQANDPPEKPSSFASDSTWERYDRDFEELFSRAEALDEEYGEITQVWITETRACIDGD